MNTVKIADNPDTLRADLEQKGSLHAATGFDLAAQIWAWTEEGTNQHGAGTEMYQRYSIRAFTEIGIRGLTHRATVTKYRRLWQAAIDKGFATEVEPGDEIEIPDIDLQEFQELLKSKPNNPTKEERKEQRKQEEAEQTALPKVDDIPDDELGEHVKSVELTKTVDRFISRVEDATDGIDKKFPGMVGSSLARLADSITDMAFDEDPRRSYLHALDAVAELVAALNANN